MVENKEEKENVDYDNLEKEDYIKALSRLKSGLFSETKRDRLDLADSRDRFQRLRKKRPELKKALSASIVGSILIGYSILFLTISLVFSGSMVSEPSYASDILLINTLFVFISILFYYFEKTLDFDTNDIRNILTKFILGIQILIFFGLAFIGAIFIYDQSILEQGLISIVPGFLSSLVLPYLQVAPIFSFVTIFEVSIFMFIVGFLVVIKYHIMTIKGYTKTLILSREDLPPKEEEGEDIREYVKFSGKSSEYDKKDIDLKPENLTSIPDDLRRVPYEGYKEVQRYWVNVPYAYISILKNENQNDYRYFVNEPELVKEHEKLLLEEFKDRLSTELLYEDIKEEDSYEEKQNKKVKILENKILEVATEYDLEVENKTFHKLLYYLERDQIYYNKIDPLMNDPNVEDISCDGDKVPIFAFHREYKDLMTNVSFEREKLRSFIIQLAQRAREHISIAEPLVDASLPDGSRAQLSLGNEVTSRGSSFTIRLFQDIPFTPVDLIQTNTFSKTQMAYLWLAIENNKSLIFAGGTASGKTTSMNAVSLFIPPKSKVVSIEDTREIELPHENWVATATRDSFGKGGGQDINMYDLLESALRQRPEYMIVGEIRGEEAKSLFQAMSTGHTTYSTMHADTVGEAMYRLTNPPINVPVKMIEALDIMCIQNQVRFVDEETGGVENVRRNETIFEFIDIDEDGQTEGHPAFERDQERDSWLERLGESNVLLSIKEENGWSRVELEEKLEEREKVLDYMVENDITEFEKVSKIVQTFMLYNKDVLRKIENDTLNPDELRDISEQNLREEYKTPRQLREEKEQEMKKLEDKKVENEAVRDLGGEKPNEGDKQ